MAGGLLPMTASIEPPVMFFGLTTHRPPSKDDDRHLPRELPRNGVIVYLADR